jgi:NAD(P)-dependent dehydrogenase (short-subunit alcohol dehydrogenase family)
MSADPLFSVEGKVVLITGSGGGIGSALTRAFIARGATVAAVERERALLEQLAASVGHDRTRLHTFPFDLTATEGIPDLIAQIVAETTHVDVLVNNAGINRPGPADEVNMADWDAILTVNLKAIFFLAQVAASYMRRRGGGRIINIASQLGIVGRDSCAPYTASKGGVILLTKSLALEWAKDNILVNAIAPGPLRTPMTEPFLLKPEQVQAATATIPLGRIGHAEEIVGAALLLASDAGNYMTGSVVVVDGGYTAR